MGLNAVHPSRALDIWASGPPLVVRFVRAAPPLLAHQRVVQDRARRASLCDKK